MSREAHQTSIQGQLRPIFRPPAQSAALLLCQRPRAQAMAPVPPPGTAPYPGPETDPSQGHHILVLSAGEPEVQPKPAKPGQPWQKYRL